MYTRRPIHLTGSSSKTKPSPADVTACPSQTAEPFHGKVGSINLLNANPDTLDEDIAMITMSHDCDKILIDIVPISPLCLTLLTTSNV